MFPAGDYNFTYMGCALDTNGNENCTESRMITYHVIPPEIAFTPPTPVNNTITSNQSIPINFSINETSYPLGDFVFDWNGSSAPEPAPVNVSNQTPGEGGILTVSCPAGTSISSYNSTYGFGCGGCNGGLGVPCGICTPGNTSCQVYYQDYLCGGDCDYGCVKPGILNLTCSPTPNDTFYGPDLVAMYSFDNISSLGDDNSHVIDLGTYGNNATCTDPELSGLGLGRQIRGRILVQRSHLPFHKHRCPAIRDALCDFRGMGLSDIR